MSGSVRLYVPCDAVAVRVQLAFGHGLSPMEETVLKAVHAGYDGINELQALLGLGPRLILDMISDLWRRDYVTVDFARGVVTVTSHVAEHIKDGHLDQLPGGEREDDLREVLVDKLTGHVLPGGLGERRVPDLRLAVPPWPGVTVETTAPADVLNALTQMINDNNRGANGAAPGRTRRVVAAHLAPADLRPLDGRRWLPIEVSVGVDRTTDRTKVAVVDRRLPVRNREIAARRLAQILANTPNSEFARHLTSGAGPWLVDPPSLEECLDRLDRRVAKAGTEPAGTRVRYHGELLSAARSALEQLDSRIRSEANVSVVAGPRPHLTTVLDMIENARIQVVLASPSIKPQGIQPFLEPIRKALDKGVQVVIVWGERRDERLPSQVASLLGSLRRTSGSGSADLRIVWSDRSSRMSTTVAICDDRRALVSGTPILDALPHSETRPIGVLVEAPTAGPCAAIETLLLWIRTILPEYRLSQALFSGASHFKTEWPAPQKQPDLPEAPPDSDDDRAASAVRAWSDAWAATAQELRRRAATRSLPQVEIIENETHRDLLDHALRHARSRLVLSSWRATAEVLTARFAAAVRQKLAEGVRVSLAYEHGGPADDDNPVTALRPASSRDTRLLRIRRQPTQARVLVADDEAVVGGFDFLSLDSYSASATQRRFRVRSELGVRVVDAVVADALCAAMGVGFGRLAARADLPVDGEDGFSIGSGAQQLLNAVSATTDLQAHTQAIRDTVAAADNPWRLLADLRRAEPESSVLRIAVAHVLRDLDARDIPEWSTWLRWLVEERWQDGAFVEAAALRTLSADPGWPPRRTLTVVGAAHRTLWSPAAVVDALSDDLSAAERHALVAVACTDLLLPPDQATSVSWTYQLQELHDVLELLDDLDPPWEALAAMARGSWKRTGAPLPLDRILADADRVQRNDRLAAAVSSLRSQLATAAQTRFDSDHSNRIHRWLFHPDGDLGQLNDVAERNDVPGVSRWLDAHPDATPTVLIDRGTSMVVPGADGINSRGRRGYETRLAAVIDAAKEVCRITQAADEDAGSGWLEAARPLAQSLADIWPALDQAANEVAQPEQRLVRQALSTLDVVAQWGAS